MLVKTWHEWGRWILTPSILSIPCIYVSDWLAWCNIMRVSRCLHFLCTARHCVWSLVDRHASEWISSIVSAQERPESQVKSDENDTEVFSDDETEQNAAQWQAWELTRAIRRMKLTKNIATPCWRCRVYATLSCSINFDEWKAQRVLKRNYDRSVFKHFWRWSKYTAWRACCIIASWSSGVCGYYGWRYAAGTWREA